MLEGANASKMRLQNDYPPYDAATADVLLILAQLNAISGSQHEADLFGAQAGAGLS